MSSVPFNAFFERDGIRIFTTCSNWGYCDVSLWSEFVGPNDYILFLDWNHHWIRPDDYWLKILHGSRRENFVFLSNTIEADAVRKAHGLHSHLVSNNIVVNEDLFKIAPADGGAAYDAVYTARAASFKRIELAKDVQNIALVINRWFESMYYPPIDDWKQVKPSFLNDRNFTPPELVALYNRCKTGLILSAAEGACFTVVEYLLCGVPVVSTKPEGGKNLGGREAWLNPGNSVYVEADSKAVAAGVASLKSLELNRSDLRAGCIAELNRQRLYVAEHILQPIFARHAIDANPRDLMLGPDSFHSGHNRRHKIGAEGTNRKLEDVIATLQGVPAGSS